MGYLTFAEGVRIGLAGECVYDGNDIITIKNFTSISVRIPHEVFGFAEKAFSIINQSELVSSLLIIAPPACGKTTLIRDLIRIISNIKSLNILVIDEKNEIFYNSAFVGETIDILASCKKDFGFYNGVKTLSPHVIVCDELINESDANGVKFAANSGVKVIATVHADSVSSLLLKPYMKRLLLEKCFEKFILMNRNFEYEEVFIE